MPKLERSRKRQLFDEVLRHAGGMWYTVIDRKSIRLLKRPLLDLRIMYFRNIGGPMDWHHYYDK